MARDEQILRVMKDPYEEIAYSEGAVLRGISLKWKVDTVLMIVKITKRMDGDLVAFIETSTVTGCWDYLATYLYTKGTPLKWRKDSFG